MAAIRPTTKAQISGHRFLRRRVEHGLVLGDIRMLHDPLGQRRRALLMGVGLSVVAAAGAGLIAWLQPNPDPGEAAILRSSQGQIFARAEGIYHPVPNVVSAQLIVGEAAEPAMVGQQVLEGLSLGAPAGLADAPGFLSAQAPHGAWAVCQSAARLEADFPTSFGAEHAAGQTIVYAGLEFDALDPQQAAVVEAEGKTWLLGPRGRRELRDDRLGVVVRRVLGIDQSVPVWQVPAEYLNAVPELAPFAVPEQLPVVWDGMQAGLGWWARTGQGVAAVSAQEAEILVAMGARVEKVSDLEDLGEVNPQWVLPQEALGFVGPDSGWLCADGTQLGLAAGRGGLVALPGDSPATHFGGLHAGGVAVDTGHGRQVVSATGWRHDVDGPETWAALGLENAAAAAWQVVSLLPEGTALSRAAALQATAGEYEDADSE